MKKNNKGFTLVELIVVLVILAILAAILVPALLGYIDKARNGQYLEEAHSIYTAVQAYGTEQYAKAPTADVDASGIGTYIAPIVEPTKDVSVSVGWGSGTDKDKHTVKTLSCQFKSQNGNTVKTTFDGTSWTDPEKVSN